MTVRRQRIRALLSGGDRRGIAQSRRVAALVEREPSAMRDLVALTHDSDWLVVQRSLDLLEKIAQADARAWALNSLAALARRRAELLPEVERGLKEFERSSSKALQGRARIRAELAASYRA